MFSWKLGSRKGFSFTELSVGSGILMFGLTGFGALYFGNARKVERVGQKTELAEQARSAYFRMTEEMKFAIDLMHPVVGSSSTPYVLFTKDNYELISYWVEDYQPKGRSGVTARRLMRMNFNAPTGRKAEVVAPFVDRIQFTRKANRNVQVEFAFRDTDNNSLVLSTGISCRNAVAVK